MQEQSTKLCPKCGEQWPRTEWYWQKQARRPDGFRTPCRACSARESRREIVLLEMRAGEGYKVCTACMEPKLRDADHFPVTHGGKYLHSHCKDCAAAKTAENRSQHPERVKQSNKASYARHKDSYNEQKRHWYAENREAALAQKAEYYKANALDIQLKVHQRRLKVEAAGELCSKEELAQKLKEQDYSCFYCSVALDQRNASIDHKLPVSRGGTNEPSNLVWACLTCNKHKNAMTAEEFFERLRTT